MKSQVVAPNVGNFIKSLRDLGYTFEIAVADILDNSITANASSINIYSKVEPELVFCMLDNGKGMDEDELIEAMRLAGKDPSEDRKKNDLGRFGLGLKTASFSQCRKLTVASKKNGHIFAAQWDLCYLESNNEWLLRRPSVDELADIEYVKLLADIECGTLIIWEEIDRYSKEMFTELLSKLRKHLSLVFHRYLEGAVRGRKIKISINNNELKSFNPFNINNPATQELSREKIKLYGNEIIIQPFILPHHSKVSQQEYEMYATEEGYTKSQGFYLYRENRLLIYGTWWGMHKMKDINKLVRIKIDISNKQDNLWGIDVKKSTANPCQEIKGDLRRIINQITEKGARTYTKRGRKILDKTTTKFWNLIPYGNEVRFELNKEHPILDNLVKTLNSEQRDMMKIYLDGIQSYIPLEAIQAQLQENPHKLKQEKVLNDNEIKMIIDKLVHAGMGKEYIQELMKTELFKNKEELLKNAECKL